eukprot:TCALIF_07040-PA protein Name:"Similar to WBSCR27 Williams-Beuren syndrome chromosomal region 27 protein (Homo sapiens)" AED:0.06 eAED:0.06 QI:0/0.75/0.4/0.8/1/1/5/424/232
MPSWTEKNRTDQYWFSMSSEKIWKSLVNNKTLDSDQVHAFYTQWAKSYDHDMEEITVIAPKRLSDIIREHFPSNQRSEALVLDVAAGTGRLGPHLAGIGFKHMDAVDYSQPMLDVLEKLDLYNKKICAALGSGRKIPGIEDESYDVVTISGGFCQAHLPIDSLEEVVRVLKPGGYFFNAMTKYYLESVDSLHGLEPLMRQMETDGKWLMRARLVQDHVIGREQGLFHAFQKL